MILVKEICMPLSGILYSMFQKMCCYIKMHRDSQHDHTRYYHTYQNHARHKNSQENKTQYNINNLQNETRYKSTHQYEIQ